MSASTLLASACCFYSDLSVLCMVVVEEIVLSLQRIYTSVNAGVGQCSLPSPNPTNSFYLQLHECHTWTRLVRSSECLHLEPTHLKYRLLNHQEASVKHLDPTCRRIDTQTPNWKITEPTQKKFQVLMLLNQPEDQEHPWYAVQSIPCPICLMIL